MLRHDSQANKPNVLASEPKVIPEVSGKLPRHICKLHLSIGTAIGYPSSSVQEA